MKKSEKKELAKSTLEKIKKLGITIEESGGWLLLKPPEKVSSEILESVSKCSDEIKNLIKISNIKG